ncbi:MAG: hypothetical protein KAQ89_03670 [Planctomycetes bacterium]|nr:hypothetical protein [Planctomycetota bacterium]
MNKKIIIKGISKNVIARSETTKQSLLLLQGRDCFAAPFDKDIRLSSVEALKTLLAMTERIFRGCIKFTVVGLVMIGIFSAGGCAESLAVAETKEEKAELKLSVDAVLEKLNHSAGNLKSYQCNIEYLFSQPLLDSQTLREGVLYYKKNIDKKNQSALRINFNTLQQDDEDKQKYVEQYIFDGIWLTHIDYQIKEVKKYQQAEPNQPSDAFELVSRNFPIIGFSQKQDLKKEFEIKLIENDKQQGDFTCLHLKVKPDSIYKDDYKSFDFTIDNKLNLPVEIIAISTEDDIYEIKLLAARANKKIDSKIFNVEIPKGFGQELIPIERKIDSSLRDR